MNLKPIIFIAIFSGCASLSVNSEFKNRYFQANDFKGIDLSKSRIHLDSKYSENSQCDSIKGNEKYGKHPPISNQEEFIRNEGLIQSHSDFVKRLNSCLDKGLLDIFKPSSANPIAEINQSSVDAVEIYERRFSNDTIRYNLPIKPQRDILKSDGDYYINVKLLKISGEAHFGKDGSTLIVNRRQVTIISTFDYLIFDLKKDTVVAGGRINVKNNLTEPYPVTDRVCNNLWREIKTKMFFYNSK
jgi:hypothetical protein